MNNRFIHLIQIPMTGVGIRPFRGNDWYKYRIDILKIYTLASLRNQTNKKFVLWMTFRPEERNNPLTLELAQYLKENKIHTVMTFNGLMYWDDKFSTGLKDRFMNAARIVRMAYREKNFINFGWKEVIREFFKSKNSTLNARLKPALSQIEEELKGEYDWVYVTRIDSDDMFYEEIVNDIQRFQPFPGALTCRNGYVYDSNTGRMAEWTPKTNPPFYTIIFPRNSFFESERYLQYFKGFKSHEDIPSVFNSQNLKDGRYCVLIHQKHISTIWEHPWKGKEIVGKEKQNLLIEFGIGTGTGSFKMDGHEFSRRISGDSNKAMAEIIEDYRIYGQQDRIWEPETTKIVKEQVKPGDVCVDVGASIGYFTLLFARQVGKDGQVYAFEPTGNQFTYLTRNVSINGYTDIVKSYKLAAWDKIEHNLIRKGSEESGSKIQANAGFENELEGAVLDDVLPERVDFIKIDVDGSEPRVLKGLIKTIERNKNLKMVIEYYPKCIEELGNDPKEMIDILDRYFTYEQIPNDYGDGYWNYYC